MKLRGKKFIHKFVENKVRNKKETADAILWRVDTVRQKAIVKIQGTNEEVVAHFPRNWREAPYWLKPRNAVRIIWREGHRGYIEIAGEGRAIPTPVEGPTMPDITPIDNYWVTGGELQSTNPASLNLIITGGTYVINGNFYAFNPALIGGNNIVMNDPAPMIMGSGTTMAMGAGQYSVTIDAAPACYLYRYDAFVIGENGVIDYIKGTTSAIPQKPPVPTDHILIDDYIFVKPNMTQIERADIGQEWTAPIISVLNVTALDEMEWSLYDDTPQVNVSLTIKDQYGCNLKVTGTPIAVTVVLESGFGQLVKGDDSGNTLLFSMGATSTLKYERNQLAAETFALVSVRVVYGNSWLDSAHVIWLLDEEGDRLSG